MTDLVSRTAHEPIKDTDIDALIIMTSVLLSPKSDIT